jgi:type I restriction enzyme R subunit
MELAGFSPEQVAHLNERRTYYLNIRDIVRKASGEYLDLKPYEADMRHLIDTYIEADEPRKLSPFEDMTLLQVIAKIGIQEAIAAQLKEMNGNKEAIAETIENNIRKKLVAQRLLDPVYFDTMSALLNEIIAQRKAKAEEYEEYLQRLAALVKKVEVGFSHDTPSALDTPAKRALWNNLGRDEELALKVDEAVRINRPDAWRGVYPREMTVKGILYSCLLDEAEVERIFSIVVAQGEY